MKAANTLVCSAATENTVTVEASAGAKDIYLVYGEDGGNTYGPDKIALPGWTQISGGEGSPIGSVSFRGERSGADQLALTVTPTVDGTLYYLVKDASAAAPTAADFYGAASISETANVSKTSLIALNPNGGNAKKVYLRYYTLANGTLVGEQTVLDVPAFDQSDYKAEISPAEINFGNPLTGYDPTLLSQTVTVKNTGSGTLSFALDTSDADYAAFQKYFLVDAAAAASIPAGASGSVTVTPKNLEAGTYTGTFYLIDKLDAENSLKLGPVTVKIVVTQKGDGTVEGVRDPEGKYTPSFEEQSDPILLGAYLTKIKINSQVSYCANYYYTLMTNSSRFNSIYENQYGRIPDVTNKELDSYTGLNPDAVPVVYPPNKHGYTPVKVGSDSSTVRDQIAKVLYYGYPNDAAQLMSTGDTSSEAWSKVGEGYKPDQNYIYTLDNAERKWFAFEIATQCAIWHYTDGIDFSDISESGSNDPRADHVKRIYQNVPSWGWKDIQNLYNFLVENDDAELVHSLWTNRGVFRSTSGYYLGMKLPAPENYVVDLYVVNNPVNISSTPVWTQNLVAGRAGQSTIDLTFTKVWNDSNNAGGVRPSATEFASWIHLYRGSTDVTSTYADQQTITDNGNNTYTISYSQLPVTGEQYTLHEEIPEAYRNLYKIQTNTTIVSDGGTLTNTLVTRERRDASLTINKVDNLGRSLDGAKFTLYADAECRTPITSLNAIVAENGTISISTKAPYLAAYLPSTNGGTATVYLKETTAPTGYRMVATPYEITLTTIIEEGWNGNSAYLIRTSHRIAWQHNESLTVVDQPLTRQEEKYEQFTVYKFDANANSKLSGATFTLYPTLDDADHGTNPILSGTTGTDGNLIIDSGDIRLRSYLPTTAGQTRTLYLKETDAPHNYDSADDVYEVQLGITSTTAWAADHSAYVTTITHTIRYQQGSIVQVANVPTDAPVRHGSATLYKAAGDSGKPLNGAQFGLFTSEADAKANQNTLETITVNGGNASALISTNVRSATADGGLAKYLYDQFPDITGTSYSDKSVTLYLRETQAPDGYQLEWDENGEIVIHTVEIMFKFSSEGVGSFTITLDNGNSLTVTDQPETASRSVHSSLTIYKVDEDEQPLAGAQFTLFADDTLQTTVHTFDATTANGQVVINTADSYLEDHLPEDNNEITYLYLQETSAPENYQRDDTVYQIQIQKHEEQAWNDNKLETVTTYTISYNHGSAITVVNTPLTSLTVTKDWYDGMDRAPVQVELTRNGEKMGEDYVRTLNAPDWTVTYEGLDKFDDNGMEYNYSVIEHNEQGLYEVHYQANPDGSVTVHNAPARGYTNVRVNKQWINGASGTQAVVVLLRNGVSTGLAKVLNEGNHWTATFENLPAADDAGHPYTYSIAEQNTVYDSTTTCSKAADGNWEAIVKNAPSTITTELSVEKKWKGKAGEKVLVYVLADGERTGFSVELSAANHWRYTFTDLPKYTAAGTEIDYTVEEKPIVGYHTVITGDAVNGFVITNEETPDVPDTGDSNDLTLWLMVLALSAGAVWLLSRRRPEHN